MDRRIPAWGCIFVGVIFLICGAYSSLMYSRSLLDKLTGSYPSHSGKYYFIGIVLCLVGVIFRISKKYGK